MSNKNNGFGLRGAVMILLLVAALGITGLLYSQSARQVREVSLQEEIVETLAVGTQPATVPTEAARPAASIPTPLPALAEEPTEERSVPVMQTEPPVLKTAAPVSGAALAPYAVDALSYNETTRDWRIHNGIDLAAEPGSPVSAAADGTVYTTYEDDALGYTVVIRHPGGYTTRYSSLDEKLCVAPGDTVTLGQTIGYAGESALVETVIGSHVHFSVSCQDLPMDPEEFFALG